MSDRNQHGLSRNIDTATKREIRRRCGFGCVNCGVAVYQYEHLDPPFSEAKSHDPEAIVLLCGGCHDRVTRGLLSKETIKKCAASPKCKETGFSFGPLDVGDGPISITIGTARFENVKHILQVNGDNIFSISSPEELGGPLRINAYLADTDGKEILRICDNEWQTNTTAWDVEVVGNRISIRRSLGDISLVLRSVSPSELVVERLSMLHKGVQLECREHDHITISTPSIRGLTGSSVIVKDSIFGAVITDNSVMFGIGGGSVTFSGSVSRIGPISNRNDGIRGQRPHVSRSRNSACPCGSGSRYKHCCGRIT